MQESSSIQFQIAQELQKENQKLRRLVKAMAKYLGEDSLGIWKARQLWVRANNILKPNKAK